MALLIRRFSEGGARPEQTVEGEVTVGRAAGNTIELPGLRVAHHHLRITPLSALRLRAECASSADIEVNGLPGQRAAELAAGDELRVGAHRLRFGFDAGNGQLTLEVHEHDPDSAADQTAAVTSLADAGWRMRRPAYWGAGLILVLLLLLPLGLKYVPTPKALGDWVPTDRLWSSGRVSNVHAQFQNQCETCHAGVFQQVRDESCLACHVSVAHHADDAAAMKHAGFDDRRCASCHFEHGGEHAALPTHPGVCTDCHANPEEFPALANSGEVRDFGDAHPPFKVSFTGKLEGAPKAMRDTLSDRVRDHSGLIFPHDLHLDSKGVSDADDKKEILVCASCHVPGLAEVGFRPQRFASDCQRCHQLDVDISGLRFRLPHGDSAAARSLLEAALAMKPAAPTPTEPADSIRGRPGDGAERGDAAAGPSEIDEIFGKRVCAKCHETQGLPGQPLAVQPPDLRQTWMTMARFTHDPHQSVECAVCHAAGESSDSQDLMLPQIDTCRSCHGGVDSSTRIPSTCIDCHRFHQSTSLRMDGRTGTGVGKSREKLANGEGLGEGG